MSEHAQRAPLISVLMTAYNREAFIGEAIESVLRQTCGNFELIVCDDSSSDRTVAIAREYEQRDPRVRVVINERNLGDYPNRNRVAELARGRYLKYHDSDDVMYPHCLQVMVTALEAEPTADFALSGSGAWPGGPCPMLLTPQLAYEREFFGTGVFQLGPACAMFRTDFFRSMAGFPLEGAASDNIFWLRACSRARVLLVSGDLFHYRVHAGQELRSQQAARDYARVHRLVWQMLHSADCPLRPDQLRQARSNYLFVVVREAYRMARAGQVGRASVIVKALGLGPIDWLRYLRPPRRSPTAGSPLAAQ